MDIVSHIFLYFVLIFLFGVLVMFALKILYLDKLLKLIKPGWLQGVLGFVIVWGIIGCCLFIVAYAGSFFGL